MSKVVNMEEALKNDLILEKVCEISDFGTLKKLRLVNKYWNEISSRVMRKRQRPIKVSIKVSHRWSFLDDLLKNLQWRANIQSLHLHCLTLADANRLTPFVLQQLPALKELDLSLDYNGFEYNVPDSVTVPEVPTDAEFSMLESLKIELTVDVQERERRSFDLDPTYLRQCTALKRFSIGIDRPELFVRFFAAWKQMYLEYPDLHRYQHVSFRMIEMDPLPVSLDFQPMMNALVEFININQPTSLELYGDFDYKFPTLFPKIERWSHGIKFLLTNVPVDAVDQKFRADLLFGLLKQYEVFADLTEISLRLSEKGRMPLNETQVEGLAKHHLSRVISLEVKNDQDYEFDPSVLQQAASSLSTVTQLTLSELDLYKRSWNYEANARHFLDLETIFNAVKEFRGLKKLCVEIEASFKELKGRKVEILNSNKDGYFKNISVVKGLTDLKLNVLTSPVRKNTALVSLFHGYEPHVRLELDIVVWNILSSDWTQKKRYKLQLSNDEFKEALRKAEAKLLR